MIFQKGIDATIRLNTFANFDDIGATKLLIS